ncbi:phage baseplate protein [Entomohabitans teleogrylli]|uniref:phage baseplate protein n=1 Tax=Entomohabitans teleogrylli TaxID=1384589 RepID=UPI00073DA28D|nr:hypothetical protein [Entomohabitans teleogrylli]
MDEQTEVYGIYGDEFSLKFENMVYLKATITRNAMLMEHPLEDGSTISDHRIFKPVEIVLSVLLPANYYQSLYREINQAWLNSELVTIHTQVGSFKSMAFAAMPHDETPTQADVIQMALTFKEVRLVTTQYQALPAHKVKRQRDQCTVNRGEQTGDKKPEKTADKIIESGGR